MILTVTKINEPIYFDKEISGYKTITLKSATLFNSFYNVYKFEPKELVMDDDESPVPKWHNLQLEEGFYSNESLIESIYNQLKDKGADVSKLKLYVDEKNMFHINNEAGYQFRLLNDHYLGFRDKWIAGFHYRVYTHYINYKKRKTRDAFFIEFDANNSLYAYMANPTPEGSKNNYNLKPYEFNFFCIHCDILDTCDNYLDEKQSDMLEMLPVIESNKFASKHVYNDNFTPKIIHSRFNKIQVEIKDENGQLIDFHNYPILLKFELK